MWKEKLQDTAASHPWLEPHEAIKRKTQAPGMQLVDWYGFTVPKTKKEMFLKQSARREDLLVVGEVDNIHSFFSDYETEWRSNILFDDLDEALRYCEDVRSGFISDIQLHSSFMPRLESSISFFVKTNRALPETCSSWKNTSTVSSQFGVSGSSAWSTERIHRLKATKKPGRSTDL